MVKPRAGGQSRPSQWEDAGSFPARDVDYHMTDSTQQAVDELKARVATMRALGVTRWGDIELGPEPAAPETTSREDDTQRSMTRERQEREREHRLRYGASGGPRVAGAR